MKMSTPNIKNFRENVRVHREFPIKKSEGVAFEYDGHKYREFKDEVYIDRDRDGELKTSWRQGDSSVTHGTDHFLDTRELVFRTDFEELKKVAESNGEEFLTQDDVRKVSVELPYSHFRSEGLFTSGGRVGGPYSNDPNASLRDYVAYQELLPPNTKWAIDFTENSLLLYTEKTPSASPNS